MRSWLTTFAAAALLVTPAALAQWPDYPTGVPKTADGKPDLNAPPPRTADGKPDLSGLWGLAPARGGRGGGQAPFAAAGTGAQPDNPPPPPPPPPGQPPLGQFFNIGAGFKDGQ